jgi:hypothetical protein
MGWGSGRAHRHGGVRGTAVVVAQLPRVRVVPQVALLLALDVEHHQVVPRVGQEGVQLVQGVHGLRRATRR